MHARRRQKESFDFKHKDSDDTLKVTVESSKDIYELSLSNVIRDLVLRNINWQEKRNDFF